MQTLSNAYLPGRTLPPERILQFGEGNFLRAFADYMIDRLNKQGLYAGSVVVVQPIPQGMADTLNAQDGLYTVHLRGVQNAQVTQERTLVQCISRCINPYADFAAFLQCAHNPDLQIILSNTTEAGIAYAPEDQLTDAPPSSFPAKLTRLLWERYRAFDGEPSKGLLVLPCELIDENGAQLQRYVEQYAAQWALGQDFTRWVQQCCHFASTLVDRIVTGYPHAQAQSLWEQVGYIDHLYDTAEPFLLWVIQGDRRWADVLPLAQAGFNVIWTDDVTPYKRRKVRILNGAHTLMVPAALLCGLSTVRQSMQDTDIGAFVRRALVEQILPTLDLPAQELHEYAASVLERFENPFIEHALLSIALNSVSKFKVRVLPSLLEYERRTGRLPGLLTFSLAALLLFYRTDEARDNPHELAAMRGTPAQILADTSLWDCDLSALLGAVQAHLARIETLGTRGALHELLQQQP